MIRRGTDRPAQRWQSSFQSKTHKSDSSFQWKLGKIEKRSNWFDTVSSPPEHSFSGAKQVGRHGDKLYDNYMQMCPIEKYRLLPEMSGKGHGQVQKKRRVQKTLEKLPENPCVDTLWQVFSKRKPTVGQWKMGWPVTTWGRVLPVWEPNWEPPIGAICDVADGLTEVELHWEGGIDRQQQEVVCSYDERRNNVHQKRAREVWKKN